MRGPLSFLYCDLIVIPSFWLCCNKNYNFNRKSIPTLPVPLAHVLAVHGSKFVGDEFDSLAVGAREVDRGLKVEVDLDARILKTLAKLSVAGWLNRDGEMVQTAEHLCIRA